MTHKRLKTAFLAAASLTSAAVATAPAVAAPIEPVAIVHAVAAADHDAERTAPAVTLKRVGFGAAALAALMGLVRLVGVRRLKAAATATAQATMQATGRAVSAGAAAAKEVARAVSSPFRFLLLVAGVGIFALTGVGLYDVEWAGGLVVGAALAALAMIGAQRTRKAFAFSRSRSRVNN